MTNKKKEASLESNHIMMAIRKTDEPTQVEGKLKRGEVAVVALTKHNNSETTLEPKLEQPSLNIFAQRIFNFLNSVFTGQ